MTSSDIRALRQLRIYGDAYAAVGATALVGDRQSQLPDIEASCKEIAVWLQALPGFSTTLDYVWATDPESYDLASEAAWQRRLTIMMMSAWNGANDKPTFAKRLENIIVVQNFMTKFGMITPRVKLAARGHARIIEVPAGFFEFNSWMNAGLRCWCGFHLGPLVPVEGDDGWTLVTTTITPAQPFAPNHVTILELIARTLAEQGRDQELLGPNIALNLREEIPWLAGPTGDMDPKGMKAVERDMSYLVMEFVLAHELGHAVSGDTDAAVREGAEVEETRAHRTALALLELTAPRRQFGCDKSLLEPTAQSSLCLTLFEFFLRCRVALISMTAARVHDVGRTHGTDDALLAEDRARLRWATELLEERIGRLQAVGKSRASGLLRTLRANGLGYSADLQAAVSAMPDGAFAAAMRIAEQRGD